MCCGSTNLYTVHVICMLQYSQPLFEVACWAVGETVVDWLSSIKSNNNIKIP